MSITHNIISERCLFFKQRVDFYATAKGLDHQSVVEHLMDIAKTKGEKAITSVIDAVVPEHLHSSRLPKYRRLKYE